MENIKALLADGEIEAAEYREMKKTYEAEIIKHNQLLIESER